MYWLTVTMGIIYKIWSIFTGDKLVLATDAGVLILEGIYIF
jgi:hypothetical protein